MSRTARAESCIPKWWTSHRAINREGANDCGGINQSGSTRALVEAVERDRDKRGDQRIITRNGGRKRDRKQMRRGGVDATDREREVMNYVPVI